MPLSELSIPRLPLGCYRLLLTAIQPIHLPPFTGSMWRGVFGHALRQIACITGQDRCDGCPHQAHCGYCYLFETKPSKQAEKMRLYRDVPHPFVLGVSLDEGGYLPPGELFVLHIVLFGRGNDYLPLVVEAFTQAGVLGIGTGKRQFRLTGVEQWITDTEEWQAILDSGLYPLPPASPKIPLCPSGAVTMRLETPVHIQRENSGDSQEAHVHRPKKRTVGPEDFGFYDFFAPLLRRCSMIIHFHTDAPFEPDFSVLKNTSLQMPILARNLEWKSLKLYSERQGKSIVLNGILGTFTIPGGEVIAPFWPVIWLGQWLHVGKDTVRGLGRYSVIQA